MNLPIDHATHFLSQEYYMYIDRFCCNIRNRCNLSMPQVPLLKTPWELDGCMAHETAVPLPNIGYGTKSFYAEIWNTTTGQVYLESAGRPTIYAANVQNQDFRPVKVQNEFVHLTHLIGTLHLHPQGDVNFSDKDKLLYRSLNSYVTSHHYIIVPNVKDQNFSLYELNPKTMTTVSFTSTLKPSNIPCQKVPANCEYGSIRFSSSELGCCGYKHNLTIKDEVVSCGPVKLPSRVIAPGISSPYFEKIQSQPSSLRIRKAAKVDSRHAKQVKAEKILTPGIKVPGLSYFSPINDLTTLAVATKVRLFAQNTPNHLADLCLTNIMRVTQRELVKMGAMPDPVKEMEKTRQDVVDKVEPRLKGKYKSSQTKDDFPTVDKQGNSTWPCTAKGMVKVEILPGDPLKIPRAISDVNKKFQIHTLPVVELAIESHKANQVLLTSNYKNLKGTIITSGMNGEQIGSVMERMGPKMDGDFGSFDNSVTPQMARLMKDDLMNYTSCATALFCLACFVFKYFKSKACCGWIYGKMFSGASNTSYSNSLIVLLLQAAILFLYHADLFYAMMFVILANGDDCLNSIDQQGFPQAFDSICKSVGMSPDSNFINLTTATYNSSGCVRDVNGQSYLIPSCPIRAIKALYVKPTTHLPTHTDCLTISSSSCIAKQDIAQIVGAGKYTMAGTPVMRAFWKRISITNGIDNSFNYDKWKQKKENKYKNLNCSPHDFDVNKNSDWLIHNYKITPSDLLTMESEIIAGVTSNLWNNFVNNNFKKQSCKFEDTFEYGKWMFEPNNFVPRTFIGNESRNCDTDLKSGILNPKNQCNESVQYDSCLAKSVPVLFDEKKDNYLFLEGLEFMNTANKTAFNRAKYEAAKNKWNDLKTLLGLSTPPIKEAAESLHNHQTHHYINDFTLNMNEGLTNTIYVT